MNYPLVVSNPDASLLLSECRTGRKRNQFAIDYYGEFPGLSAAEQIGQQSPLQVRSGPEEGVSPGCGPPAADEDPHSLINYYLFNVINKYCTVLYCTVY